MRIVPVIVSWSLLSVLAWGGEVEIAGLKSKTPSGWKEEEPSNTMRLAQFKLPRADGDAEDAELVIFFFKGGSGSVEENFKRQLARFRPAAGKDAVESKVGKVPFGSKEVPFQELSGTYLFKKRPFDPAEKPVEKANYRQVYVVLLTEKGDYYASLLGPSKTVEKHRKDFEDWLKNFK